MVCLKRVVSDGLFSPAMTQTGSVPGTFTHNGKGGGFVKNVMSKLLMLFLLVSVICAPCVFADTDVCHPAHYDGRKMVGEPDPVTLESSGFDIVLLHEGEEIASVPQYLDPESPLYASYLVHEGLWEYAPEAGLILNGLYTDAACSVKFEWGTPVGSLKKLYGKFVPAK